MQMNGKLDIKLDAIRREKRGLERHTAMRLLRLRQSLASAVAAAASSSAAANWRCVRKA